MRNRMRELTDEEIKEQQEYVQEATKRDTVNKSAAARAGAAPRTRLPRRPPPDIWVEDDKKPQAEQE